MRPSQLLHESADCRFGSAKPVGIYSSLSRREVCDDDLYELDAPYGNLIRRA